MRLPTFDIARSFPELDRFSDADCRRFIRQAVARNRASATMWTVLALLAGAAALVVGAILVWLVLFVFRNASFVQTWWWDLANLCIGVGFPVLSAAVAALLVRDRWLRRTILRMIRSTSCAACRYSLLGLSVIDGGLTCPECGLRLDLAQTDLSKADFLSKA